MNKIMKSMFAVAAVFTVVSASAQPQRGGERSPEERAKFMSERMAEKLDLTDTQKQQIYDLHIEFAKEAEAGRPERPQRREKGERPSEEQIEAMKEAREVMIEQRKARMEEMNAQMKSILTPEQFENWEKARENGRRHQGEPRMHDGERGPHPTAGEGPGHHRRHARKDAPKKQKDCDCSCSSAE